MRDYNLNDWLDKKRQKELNQVKAECRSLLGEFQVKVRE